METKQLNPLIEQFLDTIWLEQDLAENTLASYRNDLQLLDKWLDAHQLHLESVQSIDLQSFLQNVLIVDIKQPVQHVY